MVSWNFGIGFGSDPYPKASSDDLGKPWPLPPQLVALIKTKDYFVEVEMRYTSDKPDRTPVVTGIRVRRAYPTVPPPADLAGELEWRMRRRKQGLDSQLLWPEDTEPEALSPRTVRRLPLSRYVVAATAAAGPPLFDFERARQVMMPKGRPERGRSSRFYREIAEAYRVLATQGKRPVPEIARRKKVSENTVHQWVFRARELGFLERSKPRR